MNHSMIPQLLESATSGTFIGSVIREWKTINL
jgi:hypothetical protein